MKPGLSLRVSQHLALTPQLQQSIRLLQLSTLELASEIEQMLDDNPFLERDDDSAPHEEFGLSRADARVSEGDRIQEQAADAAASDDAPEPETGLPDDWDGDDSVDIVVDEAEWGGEAPARAGGFDDEGLDPGERAHGQESLTGHLHRQALALRLSPEDAAVLGFLIESLNDDGYLEDSIAQLAATLVGGDDDLEQLEQLVHRFTLALALLQSLEPVGVGARNLAECLSLQLKSRLAERDVGAEERGCLQTALKICALPGALELLARRDAKRLAALVGEGEDALHVDGLHFRVVVPMDEAGLMKTGADGEVQIGPVNGHPEFFRAPNVHEGIIDTGVLAVVPKQLMVINLDHSGVGQLLHLDFGPRRGVPGGRVSRVFFFELPQEISGAGCLFFRHGVFHDDIAVVHPKCPVFFRKHPKGLAVVAVVQFYNARL